MRCDRMLKQELIRLSKKVAQETSNNLTATQCDSVLKLDLCERCAKDLHDKILKSLEGK